MTNGAATRSSLAAEVLSELHPRRIAWALLRDGGDGGDVDVLVDPSRFEDLRVLLQRNGFSELPSMGRGSHQFFAGFDARGEWIKFDFVTDLAFGRHFEFKTDAAADCLARRRRRASWYELHPDDAFWALLFHCVLDKRFIAPDRGQRLRELALTAMATGPLALVFASIGPPSWPAERAIAAAADGDANALLELGRILAWRWRRRDPVGTLGRVVARSTLRLLERPVHLVRSGARLRNHHRQSS